jgi:hypothetical protein
MSPDTLRIARGGVLEVSPSVLPSLHYVMLRIESEGIIKPPVLSRLLVPVFYIICYRMNYNVSSNSNL